MEHYFPVYLAGVTLAAFYVGFGTGYSPGGTGPARVRGGPALLGGALLGMLFWQYTMAIVRDPYSGASMFILIAICGLVCLFGAGRLSGSLIRVATVTGPRRYAAVTLTLLLPALGLGAGLYAYFKQVQAEEMAKAEALLTLQGQTYTARFGAHDVRFPGAPVLHLVHSCRHRSNSRCHTHFWHGAGWNQRAEGPLELHALDLATNPTALAALKTWCDRKPDRSGSVWCGLESDVAIRFRRVEDLRGHEHEAGFQCQESPPRNHGCSLRHDVAPGIAALLYGRGSTQAAAEAATRAQRPKADALWAELTAR